MIGRVLLLLLQVALCWVLGPEIVKKLPQLGQLNIFAYAIIFAILAWSIGILGSVVLKDVAHPSAATLTFAIVGGLIGAGLTLLPDVTRVVSGVIKGVPTLAYPLAGAVAGYMLKR